MKKILLIASIMLLTVLSYGQTKQHTDLRIDKTSPGVYLIGTGALIDFNNGDLILKQSTDLLTLSGGNLGLGTNSLLLTGSIGSTGSRITKGWFTNAEFTNSPTIGGTAISATYVPYTGATTTLALGTNSITMTGSLASTGARVLKGWFTDISVTNAPTIQGISMAQIMTVSKTIGGVGVALCDYNFVTAANQTPQPIDLGALVPANARILNVQTVTNNTFTGATTLTAVTGTTTGANDLITVATIYTAAAITATPNGGVFIGAPSATAVHVWLTATPGANWSLVTAGKVTVYVTYIAY